MDLKVNDKILCKKSNGIFKENHMYKVTRILTYSTLNVTLTTDFWNKRRNDINYTIPENCYLISIEDHEFSGFDIFNFFYSKKETRKLKIKKLSETQ